MKWSNFHVTMGFHASDDNASWIDKGTLTRMATRAIQEVFSRQGALEWLKYYGDRRQQPMTPEMFDNDVDAMRTRAAFESEGTRNRSLHAHILVEVAHFSSVQIGAVDLKHAMETAMGHGIKISQKCRFVPGTGEDKAFVLDYLFKEVPRVGPETSRENRALAEAFERGTDVYIDD